MREDYGFKREDFEKKFLSAGSQFPQFSEEEIQILVEAFREFDADNSGSIDIHELRQLFNEIGQGISGIFRS
jgi:Ca2+-binding EF-hand superfamily protein